MLCTSLNWRKMVKILINSSKQDFCGLNDLKSNQNEDFSIFWRNRNNFLIVFQVFLFDQVFIPENSRLKNIIKILDLKMNKSLIFVGLAVVTLLVGFAANNADVQSYLRKNLTEPVPVPYVDIQKYSGSWYEQAVIPYYFERGCSHTVATYSLNPDGKSVKV